MKIGIVTFWQSDDNYGQVMQCWALQQQLIKMGHQPYLIKYSSKCVPHSSILFKLCKAISIYPLIKVVTRKIEQRRYARFALSIAIKNEKRCFNSFRNQNIIMGEKTYESLSEIQKDPPEADLYLCGSDQVWSMSLANPENRAYFLDFGKKDIKRIAYAASFGCETYPSKLNKSLYDLLVRFSAISVREDSGVRICNKIGIEASKVLDPTLLLSKAEYLQIAESPQEHRTYFYSYTLNVSSTEDIYWEELVKYSSRLGLKSISTTSSGYFPGRELCADTQYVYATIPQWLGLIHNAQFVVTTSFHGLLFSLVFHKNFIYIPLKGKYAKGNNRALSLLSSLRLSEKVCWNKDYVINCLEASINWDDVESLLKTMRKKSVSFLRVISLR